MKTVLLYTLFCLAAYTMYAQCPTGTIGVSGAGCGCLSGCNLTSYGGPNCGGASGNCSAGQVAMSIDITVPSGCTYTVTATMTNRGASCSASGADSGDKMKVDAVSGSKSYQAGTGNATLNDSYTLNGPGTIRVSGTANRADEIITYSTTSTGCVNCSSSLPIELTAFNATMEGSYIACTWQTNSERNNDYFIVERSADGILFEPIGQMDGAGDSQQPLTYKLYDSSPLTGLSYYRLKQTDFNGASTYSEVRSVLFAAPQTVHVYPNPSTGELHITGEPDSESVHLYTASGQEILVMTTLSGETTEFFCKDLTEGVYILTFLKNGQLQTEKITVLKR